MMVRMVHGPKLEETNLFLNLLHHFRKPLHCKGLPLLERLDALEHHRLLARVVNPHLRAPAPDDHVHAQHAVARLEREVGAEVIGASDGPPVALGGGVDCDEAPGVQHLRVLHAEFAAQVVCDGEREMVHLGVVFKPACDLYMENKQPRGSCI
jgi:hypothetical protein